MGTKKRGGAIMGAEIQAKGAREAAKEAAREADRAEAQAWSVRMEGYGGLRSRPRWGNVSTAASAGWRSNAGAARPALACRSTPSVDRGTLRFGSWKPHSSAGPARKAVMRHPCALSKLTETREITPYRWVHPDEDR
jgi:hypothetical protein